MGLTVARAWRARRAAASRPTCRRRRAARAPTSTSGRTRRAGAARRVRHVRPPRVVARTARSTRRTSLAISRGDLPLPRGAGHRRPAVPRPRHARAVRAGVPRRSSRCSSRTASTSVVDADDGFTPTPAISHAILTHNRGGGARHAPTASSSRRRTTRPRTAASSTTRRTAARPTPTSRAGSRSEANRLLEADLRRRRARPARGRATRADRHDYVGAYVDDLPAVIDLDAIRGAGLRLGVDPLGGASVAYWQAIARALRPRPDDRQRRGRPDRSAS